MRPPRCSLARPQMAGWTMVAVQAAIAACVAREPDPDPNTFTLASPSGPEAQDSTEAPAPAAPAAAAASQAPIVALAADYSTPAVGKANGKIIAVIAGIDSGLCLDTPASTFAAGDEVHVFPCLGPDNGAQNWVWDRGRLVIGGSFCLSPTTGNPSGAPPVLAACVVDQDAARLAGQLWSYQQGTLALASTTVCLSLGRDTAVASAPLRLAACNANDSLQQWGLANVAKPDGADPVTVGLTAHLGRAPTYCMDVLNGRDAVGTAVGIYNCNGLGAQMLVLQGMRVQFADKCIGVSGSAAVAGAALELQACSAAATAQAWRLDEGGLLQLVSPSASLCMCVPPGAPKDQVEAPLQLLPCQSNGAANTDCVWSLGAR